MRSKISTAILVLATAGLADDPLKVVVDTPLMKAAVLTQASPEDVEISVLLEPGHSAHHFHIKPSQAKMLAEADYVLGIGSNFMPELVEAARNTNPSAENVKFYYDDYLLENADAQKPEDIDDPHLWLSPVQLAQISTFFADVMGKEARAISASDFELSDDIEASLRQKSFPLIASHNAFGIFENYYEITSHGAFHDMHDQPLPPRQFDEIVQKIDAGEISCVLMEEDDHAHDIEELAEDKGLKIVEFDILGWEWQDDPAFFDAYFGALAEAYRECGN